MPGIGGSIERVTDQDRLKGVRRWLLLPPVVVGLHILSLVLELMRLAIWGSEGGEVHWADTVIMSVLFIPLGTFAIMRLLQERKSGRRLMIIFFSILFALTAPVVFISPSSENPFVIIATYRAALISAGLILYFLVSRPLKLTLVS